MKFTDGFKLLATSSDGIKRLRELILSLAVQGKLVPQDASDESASELLKQIRAEKDRLIADGKIKKNKPLPAIDADEKPFELPERWEWVRLGQIGDWAIGSGFPTNEQGSTGLDVLFAKVSDMNLPGNELEIVNANNTISWEQAERLRVNVHPVGTVVFPKIGGAIATNKRRILIRPTAIDNNCLGITPNGLISTNYLFLLLTSIDFTAYQAGTSVPALSQSVLAAIVLALPPLAEQSRIVAKVEELMALCDALETRGKLDAEQHARLTATLFDALAASESARQLQENWARLASHFDLILDRPAAVDALEQTLLQLAVRGLLVPQRPIPKTVRSELRASRGVEPHPSTSLRANGVIVIDGQEYDQPASELLKQIRLEKDRLIAEGKIKKDKPLPAISDEEKPFELPEGWEWVRFGDIVNISSGVTLGRKTAIPDPILLPYLRVANVQRWKLVLHDVKELIIDKAELERFSLKHGDLLITEGGDWDKVGRTCVWEDNLPICLHQNHVFKVRATYSDWNYRWAELYLNSNDARAYFASSAKQTTNLASINMTQLKNCLFPMPPLAVQSRIVARVEALRALCAQLRERLATSQKIQTHLAETLVEQAA